MHYNLDGIPPLATIFSPVMYEASSLHKNATTPDISLGSPNLKDTKIFKTVHITTVQTCLRD